jgi:subtilisin
VDVDVAVIDTGVDFQHPDLNVVGGVNCASGSPFTKKCSSGGDDDHYHGTHVAGTIGASTTASASWALPPVLASGQ